MPTKSDVKIHVLNFLHSLTGFSAQRLEDDFFDTALQDSPLDMDTPSLAHLAAMLRAYIQNTKPGNTFLVQEARKQDLMIRDLVDMVFSKV